MNTRTWLNQYGFLLSCFFIALCTVSNAAEQDRASRPPNIVYINIDDLGWTDLGYQGSKYYETPNIDALAARGMVFSNAYAPAANCAPSRACCLTGQYTPRHGVYTVGNSERGRARDRRLVPTPNTLFIPYDRVTLADALKAAGYTTCSIGKWHISEDPLKNGFDINIAGGSWGGPYHGGYHSPYDYPNCVAEEEGEYLTDRLTNEAIGFIEKHRDRPFFLYFAHYAVHSPLQAKAEQKAKYDQKPGTVAHGNSTYAAMIESVDENLGRLFHSLQEAGIEKETLILFTSDNGGVWNTTKQWPLRAGKGSYYEGGIREPMIVFWDGKIEAGSRCDVPVSGIDFFPTLAEAAGAEIPAGTILDGVSLMPLLTGTGQIAERPLYWHFPIYLEGGNSETRDPRFRTRPGSVIRFGDWKLHEYFEDGGIELYNLADDIGEKKDLSTSHPERAAELHDMLVAWRNRLNAPVPTTRNPAFKVEN